MRKIKLLRYFRVGTRRLATALCVALVLAAHSALATPPQRTAFVGVNVLAMDEPGVRRNWTVVVEDGRIEAMGPAASSPVPAGARRVEGRGAWLMPGLAEMHAHVPGSTQEQWARDVLFLYVANGITTARGMLGEPWHLVLREAIASHEVLGPRLYTSGPSLNGNTVDSPEDAAHKVRAQHDAGYDFIKTHGGLTEAEFTAMASTARRLGMPFAGHVSGRVGVIGVLGAGQATIDHLDQYMEALVPAGTEPPAESGFFGMALVDQADPGAIPRLAQATAAAGTWNVPTQTMIEHFLLPATPEALAATPGLDYVPVPVRERWSSRRRNIQSQPWYDAARAIRYIELRRRLIAALDKAGAGLLLGSDAPQVYNVPGFSIHGELRALVSAGVTPRRALAAGTVNPARFFGAADEFGAIRVGLDADIVLVSGNPLEDLAVLERPLGVMVRGHWLDRAALDQGLAEIAARYAVPDDAGTRR